MAWISALTLPAQQHRKAFYYIQRTTSCHKSAGTCCIYLYYSPLPWSWIRASLLLNCLDCPWFLPRLFQSGSLLCFQTHLWCVSEWAQSIHEITIPTIWYPYSSSSLFMPHSAQAWDLITLQHRHTICIDDSKWVKRCIHCLPWGHEVKHDRLAVKQHRIESQRISMYEWSNPADRWCWVNVAWSWWAHSDLIRLTSSISIQMPG